MRYDVILSLRGCQTYPDSQPEVIELMTDGVMEELGDCWKIRYEESKLTGLEGVTTEFTIQNDRIILDRTGNLNSRMVFQPGVTHNSLYQMEFGALMLAVTARDLSANLSEEGGTIDLRYSIDIEQSSAGEIEYHLEIKRKQG